MRPVPNPLMQSAMKVAKRVAITILICIPIMVTIAYLLREYITKDWQMILLFVSFMAVAVLIEEVVVRKKERRKEALKLLEKDKDVFK